MNMQAIKSIVFSLHMSFCVAQLGNDFTLGTKQLKPLDPPVKTANSTGTFGIGVHKEIYQFMNRQLNVSWWYPAEISPNSKPYFSTGGISGEAFWNETVDQSQRPYPLIVFSPGLGAVEDSYYFYCQNLASSGYIVASISHWDATAAPLKANPLAVVKGLKDLQNNDSSAATELEYSYWFRSTHIALTYRRQEIEYVLDKAMTLSNSSTHPFYGTIDIDNIGLSGHSLGGFYTLLMGAGIGVNCDEPLTPAQANTLNPILTDVSFCAWPETKTLSSPTALHDKRFKAALSLAPPLFILPDEITRAAGSIKSPLMIISGNDARYESTLAPQKQVYDGAIGPKYMVEINATDHLLVSDGYQFNPGLTNIVPTYDRFNFTQKAEVYMIYSAAFFDLYLKNNTTKRTTLHESFSNFVTSLIYSD